MPNRVVLQLSHDPEVAREQLEALIVYLTTLGHIDGHFDDKERRLVEWYIRQVVEQRVLEVLPDADPAELNEQITSYTHAFTALFERTDKDIGDLLRESVAYGEDQQAFLDSRLKLRCYEAFQHFDHLACDQLLAAVDDVVLADGHAHPAEVALRAELVEFMEARPVAEPLGEGAGAHPVTVHPPIQLPHEHTPHPLYQRLEHHYSAQPETLVRQLEADQGLMHGVTERLAVWRTQGRGKLDGVRDIGGLDASSPFVDRWTWVWPMGPGKPYELTVLGDLHGCYSCLKAALEQSSFLQKVAAYKEDPTGKPYPLLVFLGDYIDRGLFSFNGILRAAMLLFVSAPEHVVLLRGNHEYFLEHEGSIWAGVTPAEALYTLKPHVPQGILEEYMNFFERLPNTLLFDRMLFVHGGLPRDSAIDRPADGHHKAGWRGLAALNDADVRFQMMWSDPSQADIVPRKLQDAAARFAFGRQQARSFLSRLGCHTMVRGHEKIDEGFRTDYSGSDLLVCTLFSAGGAENQDLPPLSAYRWVTPMAMTITGVDGVFDFQPWVIDYEPYNEPENNGFFRRPPELPIQGNPEE